MVSTEPIPLVVGQAPVQVWAEGSVVQRRDRVPEDLGEAAPSVAGQAPVAALEPLALAAGSVIQRVHLTPVESAEAAPSVAGQAPVQARAALLVAIVLLQVIPVAVVRLTITTVAVAVVVIHSAAFSRRFTAHTLRDYPDTGGMKCLLEYAAL